ncbi:MAG: HIT domain-containing protein [Alphaproteobacteria bacterium]|nr:HIT domain-containing protein [Alphaproteobacteria bacterium]
MAGFILDDRLAADTAAIGRLALSHCLLMNDCTYPWMILVPERADVREFHQLDRADRAVLMEEIVRAQLALQAIYKPDKLNVGALGNAVPQLHIHVIARFKTDAAGLRPVWGVVPAAPYNAAALKDARDRIAAELARSGPFAAI